ncbi:DUF262 domain-containing protein [Thauera sp. CAU 1555]|uniref:DUF262 domain-containing protein n=1 Tax=Thauera sedimentorum TaxID=2767595 RepID=A0ABR9BBH5_9RHOO|nr:DUF262 domain-containing protein [Thauera sedimentorum]MBC9072779.1 DUF262 domain-containing protein [Thauera sedimentorum]MBD8503698.1 DUF262 domain-containing protein [Thauera sedimentorum]
MKKPELNTTSLKIDKLINRVDNGEIKIPAFQRGYVWKQNQIIELLESLVKQYPIGSILLWEATQQEKLRSTRNIAGYRIPDKGENWPVNYVLDGQQRLSSIYSVLSDNVEQEESSEKYNPNLDIFEIYYDFSRKAFLPKSDADRTSRSVVLLRNIIDPIKLVDELSGLDKKHHSDAKTLSSIFLNYEVPVVQIKNRTKEEVGVIFERINNTGTKLNTLDLMTAWTWTEDFHLLDAIDELLEELEEKSFGSIDPKLMLQIVSGIIIGSTKTENVLRLTGERVRDNWENIEESIKAAIDFLSTEMKCSNIEFLPFHQQLIPLSRLFAKTKRVTVDQISVLKQYFWRTSFSDRYSTGQTTAKMDADIEFVNKVLDYDFSDLSKYGVSVTSKDLIETQFSKANPVTRAFLLLCAQHEPLDLANGRKVDVGNSLSSFNRKQYHHVFPNSFLTKNGVPKSRRFSVLNFCFLPSDSNKKISCKSPSDYFSTVVPVSIGDEILKSNLLPMDSNIYAMDDYDAFLERRGEVVLKAISQVTG